VGVLGVARAVGVQVGGGGGGGLCVHGCIVYWIIDMLFSPIKKPLSLPEWLSIMLVFGRLVQLVRILGRHPRGRGFEFLTAHQNLSSTAM
jgi:hypothetical protein